MRRSGPRTRGDHGSNRPSSRARAAYLRANNRAALGPTDQWHRVDVPADGPRPVWALRRRPHRAEPGFGRSADHAYLCSYHHLRGNTVVPAAWSFRCSGRTGQSWRPSNRKCGTQRWSGAPISRAINELNATHRHRRLSSDGPPAGAHSAGTGACAPHGRGRRGCDLKPLLDGIQAREQRRRSFQTELAGLEGLQRLPLATARTSSGRLRPASRTGEVR